MPKSNEQIIRDAGTIQTTSLASGLLNPEQAQRFIRQTFDGHEAGRVGAPRNAEKQEGRN